MKIFHFATFALAGYAQLSLADEVVSSSSGSNSHDEAFKPPTKPMKGEKGGKKLPIKTRANFGKSGAQIDLCLSGECTQMKEMVKLKMSRLEEIDSTGKSVRKAANFNKLDGVWTSLEESNIGGASVMSTSYVSDVTFNGNTDDKFHFNLTASIYEAEGEAINGNDTIIVPAGALKFTIEIEDYPFLAETNSIQFGVSLIARGKDGKAKTAKPTKAKKEKKNANETAEIDRVNLGDGMYMDVPLEAITDDTANLVASTIEGQGSTLEYVWVFPYFSEKLYYDPVIGSSDPTLQVTDEAATSDSGSSSTTSSNSDSTGDASKSSANPITKNLLIAPFIAALVTLGQYFI